MAVYTKLNQNKIEKILSNYNLGKLDSFKGIEEGISIFSIFFTIYLLCSWIFKKVYPVLNLVIPPADPILIILSFLLIEGWNNGIAPFESM